MTASAATAGVDPFGRHYTPAELAELWRLDESTIRRMFQDEEGVFRIGKSGRRDGKRDYVTLRIPEAVARRSWGTKRMVESKAMLTIWRRHSESCPHQDKGRDYLKCNCPLWADGYVDAKRTLRRSLETRDMARARKRAIALEDPTAGLRPCAHPGCEAMVERGRCEKHTCEISAAITAYHAAHSDVAEGTKRNRRRALRFLDEFLSATGIRMAEQVDLEALHAFRTERKLAARTWIKELEILRHFFGFCLDNDWTSRNWAQKVRMPKNLKPAPREPYEPNEIIRIIAACDVIGRTAYERLRARAMVLLLRYTALRVSDVALLKRNRIRDGEIFLRTAKNGKPVKLPVHPELQGALDVLPVPRAAADGQECAYFFWSGNGSTRAFIRDCTRALATVYKTSGVVDACSHRFRHTLATEVLELGGSIEEAADPLGDSEAIVRKHYAKWSAGRRARIASLLQSIWAGKPAAAAQARAQIGHA